MADPTAATVIAVHGNILLMATLAATQGPEFLHNHGNLAFLAANAEAITPPPVPFPPTVVDVPAVVQAANVLNCTMGNWTGEPTSYAYQWHKDGVDIGAGAASYALDAGGADVGTTFDCTVTATNDQGSASSTSNALIVA